MEVATSRLAVRVNSAVKHYGEITALNGVSLEIWESEKVAILGPNGAGKTTLLKAISGSLRLSSGRIIVKGIDVSKDPVTVRSFVGFVPEENIGFSELTVKDNLLFISKLFNVPRQDAESRIKDVTEKLDLEYFLDRRLGSLSRGYRRRVSIAAALIHEPSILVLDEPFSGLDPASLSSLYEFLDYLNENGISIIVASHNIGMSLSLADRIYILSNGKIIESGDRERIRRILGWREELFAVKVTPVEVSHELVNRLLERGIRASRLVPGEVRIVGQPWDVLEGLVTACELLNCRVERFLTWQITWEEAFSRFLKELQGGVERCSCCGRK